MTSRPRVAFFTDSFHEVNGVALTSRQFVAFARRRRHPIFSVRPGPATRHWREGEAESLELGPGWPSLQIEHDLKFDLRFYRHREAIRTALRMFEPDLVHITGPGHCGMLGAFVAHDLQVPLAASWHTNIHEFASLRLAKMLQKFHVPGVRALTRVAEQTSLRLVLRFYRLAKLGFAPNPELVDMLSSRLNRPFYLMERGVDNEMFSPSRRTRIDNGELVIGYVGRLSAEKSVRTLARLERALLDRSITNARFVIVGDGIERAWLRENLRNAELPGVQVGETLAQSYANMDVFVFPSTTDTFGNVVVEAHASGVPVVVTSLGGPKYLVRDGIDGFVTQNEGQLIESVCCLLTDVSRRRQMGEAGRHSAFTRSWDAVMESVFGHYVELASPGGSSAEWRLSARTNRSFALDSSR